MARLTLTPDAGGDVAASTIAKVWATTAKLLVEFKVVVSLVVLGLAFTLGVLDVPVFRAIVDGLVALAQAGIAGIGQ